MRNAIGFTKKASLTKLYSAYVRPHVEYASNIWCPYYIKHANQIERIQKKFLRYLYYKKHNIYDVTYPYELLRNEFNLLTLYERRNIHSALIMYKIINNKIDSTQILDQLAFCIPKYKYRRIVTFDVPLVMTSYLYHSPLYRMMRLSNEVSQADIFGLPIQKYRKLILIALSDTTKAK